jgi:hypothetical protein
MNIGTAPGLYHVTVLGEDPASGCVWAESPLAAAQKGLLHCRPGGEDARVIVQRLSDAEDDDIED